MTRSGPPHPQFWKFWKFLDTLLKHATNVCDAQVFGDIQYRSRKTTEALVEKRHKQLQDWRATEAKAKSK